jgi:Mrp family chromosome partitioning ATPase
MTGETDMSTHLDRTNNLMLDSERKLPLELNPQKSGDYLPVQNDGGERRPVEFKRPVIISTTPGEAIDEKVVTYSLYNSFNYSLFLPQDYKTIKLSLGVTSPNQGEGKTTAICNLATAISMGIGRKTLVMDLNANRPRIHQIFGTSQGPGVSDALSGGDIVVVPTQVDNLFVMPLGTSVHSVQTQSPSFRQLLSSLFQEFEFILVDLPSVSTRSFPTLIANQLNGLIVVVKSKKTKRRDINRLFRRVRQETVLAFVMNEVDDNDF